MSSEGQILADLGMDQAVNAADLDWLRCAKQAVWALCEAGVPFSSDRVWALLDERGVRTGEPRALGAVFRAAQRAGYLRPDGWEVTARPQAHGRGVRVWAPTGKAWERKSA